MHELAVVEALIEQVKAELDRAGHRGRVARLEIRIGRLSGVHPDSVRFAFEMLSPDTIVEGAELAIEEPKPVCRCRDCGKETVIDALVVRCPQCESANVVIEGGRDMTLQSIDVEEA